MRAANLLPRFYLRHLARNAWQVWDRQNKMPVYDNAPHGQDKPLVFRDEDAALECVERLNAGGEKGFVNEN